MTYNEELERFAKDWLFAGEEPKPQDEVLYEQFKDFLTSYANSRIQEVLAEVEKAIDGDIELASRSNTPIAVAGKTKIKVLSQKYISKEDNK